MRIAIDGPGGAGKSTIAKQIARELGMFYLDTGAMYRTAALKAKEMGIDPKDEEAVAQMMEKLDIDVQLSEQGTVLVLDGHVVGEEIRTPEISMMASTISALPVCRRRLTEMQRHLGQRYDVVMDGRDIGTVVLPDAEVKIFLTASPEERARRRFKELTDKGRDCHFEEIFAELQERDLQDSSRSHAPLKQADDAYALDSEGKSISEVIAEVKALITAKNERN